MATLREYVNPFPTAREWRRDRSSASGPSSGRGGRGRGRQVTFYGFPEPSERAAQSVSVKVVAARAFFPTFRPWKPGRPVGRLRRSAPENHDPSWSSAAAAPAQQCLDMVEGLCQALWNGSEAFPDFFNCSAEPALSPWRTTMKGCRSMERGGATMLDAPEYAEWSYSSDTGPPSVRSRRSSTASLVAGGRRDV